MNRSIPPALKWESGFVTIPPYVSKLYDRTPFIGVVSPGSGVARIEWAFDCGITDEIVPLSAGITAELITQGTITRTSRAFNEELDKIGAYTSLQSGWDSGLISVYVMQKYMEQAIDLMYEAFNDTAFRMKEFKTAVKVRKQAFKTNMSKSSFVASLNLNPILFKNHPYSRMVTEEDYDKINRDDILFFYKKKFLKARRRIFFTGDVDITKIEDIFRWHGMPRQLWYVRKIQPITGYIPVNVHIPMKDSVQSSLRVAKPLSINELHPDFAAIKMTNVLLGGYFGSRLMSSLREHHGFTYGVSSSVNIMRQGASIVISTDVGNDVSLKAIEAIFKELKKLTTESVSTEELDRVKKYMAGSLLRSFDGCMAVGDVYKSLMSKELPLDFYENYFSDLMKLTPDDILNVASKWFHPDSFSVLRVGDTK